MTEAQEKKFRKSLIDCDLSTVGNQRLRSIRDLVERVLSVKNKIKFDWTCADTDAKKKMYNCIVNGKSVGTVIHYPSLEIPYFATDYMGTVTEHKMETAARLTVESAFTTWYHGIH